MLDRRTFLSTLGAAGALGAQTPARPNVLVFLSDQESERVPRELLRLPNRERLERRGVRFTRAWCATPQCSPGRGALWTGRWPHRTGVVANIGAEGASPLDPRIPSLGRAFHDAGYETGYFGKWHLSEGRVDAKAFGYDAFRERGDSPGDAGVTAAAAQWIGARERPWLAVVSLIQPHDVYDFPRARAEAEARDEQMPIRPGTPAPPSGAEDLAERPEPQRAYREQDQGQPVIGYDAKDWQRYRSFYYDLIEDADRNLGVLLDALGDGFSDTVIAYTSDHGDGLGAHGLPFKGPFFYEEVLNIPLVLAWPGRYGQARVSDELVSQVDLTPTLCDLAGVKLEGADGASLRPALEGKPLEREEMFAEYHSKQRWANPARIVRTKRWKLAEYLRGGRELYDLEKDPDERENLAGKGLAAEKDLLGRLDAQARRTTDVAWFEKLGTTDKG
ncbi:MAG: sulfatase-like hydrolase/transferase [Bryobacterales bacterium]|nr:sulfatase-like hydrolase/transferase [Bryobacterales bacterium]